jgi:hypothetical protein
MTEDELIRLEALANAATAGPWVVHVNGNTVRSYAINGVCSGMSYKNGNADFIAASRIAVPALIAEVRRLRAELEQARPDVEFCDSIRRKPTDEHMAAVAEAALKGD